MVANLKSFGKCPVYGSVRNHMRRLQTKRILKHRLNEHNNPKKDLTIQTHQKEFPTNYIDPYKIEIIDRADTNSKIELKEELHIIAKKPQLNIQNAAANKNTHGKDLFKKIRKTLIIVSEVVSTFINLYSPH